MRRVRTFKWVERIKEDGGFEKKYHEKVFDRDGWFHTFGVSYDDTGNGVGNYSTAIIEFDDGTVEDFSVNDIQFFYPASDD